MRKTRVSILLCTFLLFTRYTFSQVKTQNYVNKNKVYLGDTLYYKIVVTHRGNLELGNFDIYNVLKGTTGIENFVLISSKIHKKRNFITKKITQEYIFNLIPINLGKITIGEIQIPCVNKETGENFSLKLPQVEVEVSPYPKPKDKIFDGEIIDIKGQIWIRSYLWIFLLLFIFAGVLLWVYYQYKTQPKPTELTQQQINLTETALRQLEELWEKNYIQQGLIKQFYLELTSIVRWYIEKKYDVNALELTTGELYNALKKKVEKKYNLELKSFLENGDLAKFAKYIPDQQQIKSDFETAKKLVMLKI
ncbi:MAG: hypothetical protein N2555_03975 [Endomicrobia bacterium]|nr:hypothetical protein [Endomicrobiia bacterium]